MTIYEAIHEVLAMCEEARIKGEALPVDMRFLDALMRYERRRLGLPHPLSKFAVNGGVKDCPEVEMLLDCLHEISLGEPGSIRRRSAEWFLLENGTMYFAACEKAGIDGRKLRRNLGRVQRVSKRRGEHG